MRCGVLGCLNHLVAVIVQLENHALSSQADFVRILFVEVEVSVPNVHHVQANNGHGM